MLEVIKTNIYEYLDLNLQNTLSLSKLFKYILKNKSLEIIRDRFKIIENDYIKLIYRYLLKKQLKCIDIIKKYIMQKNYKLL